MLSHIKVARMGALPDPLRRDLVAQRHKRGWSQAEVGRRVGLPQMHISGIETGKLVPRFDTLLDLVRVLDYDLLLVPRALVPAVQALIRNHQRADRNDIGGEERSLYADNTEPEEAGE
jgi:HTH-type transcriptional regulator/antitoxin HipB